MADDLITYTGLLLVVGSVITGRAAKVALLILLWHTINIELLHIVDASSYYTYWPSLVIWSLIMAAKDYLFILFIGFGKSMYELIITICIVVSSLLHQIILIEAYNKDLTLFYARTDIMVIIISAIFASIILILIGGGSNGGKRAKRNLHSLDRINNRFLHLATYKAKS